MQRKPKLLKSRTAKLRFLLPLLLVLLTGTAAAFIVESISNPINCLLCKILNLLWAVATGIAVVVVVEAGIKWMGSMEDPGARAHAKTQIVHAFVGLIIVIMAIQIIGWVTTGSVAEIDATEFLPAPAGSGCNNLCA